MWRHGEKASSGIGVMGMKKWRQAAKKINEKLTSNNEKAWAMDEETDGICHDVSTLAIILCAKLGMAL